MEVDDPDAGDDELVYFVVWDSQVAPVRPDAQVAIQNKCVKRILKELNEHEHLADTVAVF